jgi:hypothetical protein
VEGVCGGPDVLRDVDEVEQDVDGDVAAFGFGVDEAELVVGAVKLGCSTTRTTSLVQAVLVLQLAATC